MKRKLIFILSLILLIGSYSCDFNRENDDIHKNTVHFGGKIINPVDSVVYFIRVDRDYDSIVSKLDENNFFHFDLDSIETRKYYFVHGDELQYVFLEPGDSLMLRLNTTEFDESLVFTGIGASINNYLVKKFLLNESNKVDMVQLLISEPKSFEKQIDSLKNIEYQLLADYNYEGGDLSEKALSYAEAAINFEEYLMREQYPKYHTILSRKLEYPAIDDDFFYYRDKTSLNDSSYINDEFYLKYIYWRLDTYTSDSLTKKIGFKEYYKNISKYDNEYYSIYFYYVDKLIKLPELKENLLFSASMNLFAKNLSQEELNKQLIPFFKYVKDPKKIKKIEYKLNNYVNLNPGSPAPDFKVWDGKQEKMLSDYFGKPIYMFFWLSSGSNGDTSWHSNQTREYNRLKELFPDVQFLSVFLDWPELWEKSMEQSGASGIQLNADYRIIKDKYLLSLHSTGISFVLIDSEGKIVESNASWPSSPYIKTKLKNLK